MAFTSDTTRTWGRDFETLWGEKINPALPLTEENCDSRYYRQFWVNAVRWLAGNRVGRTNTAVSLELAQSYCRPDEKVAARIKVRDPEMREIARADVNVYLCANGNTNLAGKAVFDSASRSYVAECAIPKAGDYQVTAVATVRGATLGDDRQLLVCEESDKEMSQLPAKPDLMDTLARVSGGRTLSLTEVDAADLAPVFYNASTPTVEYRRKPLWDRSWWLAAVLGLLSVEWALRRANGLA
jgi:hypothetical protein